ncbi:unnamed protein product, partial [Rotaria sp. Silwood2]
YASNCIEHFLATQYTGITWKPNGKRVAGGNGPGSNLNQLNSSYGAFVDLNDVLFFTDYFNNRVAKCDQGASRGLIYAEGQCGTSNQDKLCNPTAITFNKEGTLLATVQYG